MAGSKEVGKVSIRVIPDLDRFREELQGELEKLERKVAEIRVGADTSRLRDEVRAATSNLPDAQVTVNADTSRIGGQLRNSLKGVTTTSDKGLIGLSRGLTDVGKSADSASASMGRLRGRTQLITFAVFAAAAPAIGLVSGLLAGLPSLISAFAAGGAAVALGLDGIKAAAESVKPAFDELKAAVSGTFQDQLTPIFQQFLPILPQLKSGFQEVASGLSGLFQGFANAATSVQGVQQIGTILQGVGGFFRDLGPVVQTATQSFLTLASSGAQSFGLLLAPLQNFANGFDAMVQRITSNGVFEGALQGLSQTLDGIFTLFTRLFEVGAQAMGSLGGPLQNLLGGFGDLLVGATPALTAFAAGVANTIGALGTSLAPAFAALTPAVSAISPILTQLASTLGTALSQAVVAVAPALTQLAQVLGPVLTAAATALAPILAQLATTLGGVLTTAIQALAPLMPLIVAAFTQLATALSGALAQVLPQLAQTFAALLPVFIQLVPPLLQLVQAFIPLIPAAANLATAALQVLSAFAPLLNIISSLAGVVAQVIGVFAGLAAAMINAVTSGVSGVVSSITGGMSQFVSAITSGVASGIAEFVAFGARVVSACSGFGSLLVSAGKDLIQGLVNGIKSMAGAALQAAQDVASSVVGAVKGFLGINSPSTVFRDIGVNVGEGFNEGVGSQVGSSVAQIKEYATAILQSVKDVFGSAEGVNLNFNLNAASETPALSGLQTQLASTSASAADFKQSMGAAGQSLTQIDTTGAKQKIDQLGQSIAELEIRRKELQLAKDNPNADQGAIKAQLEQIRNQKTALGLERDKLNYAQKYGGQMSSTSQSYQEQIKSLQKMPLDFATSTGNQFLSDLGWSGQGAIPSLMQQGLDYASSFVFNVANMDDALSGQRTLQNRQMQATIGR
jgi:phage-related protein